MTTVQFPRELALRLLLGSGSELHKARKELRSLMEAPETAASAPSGNPKATVTAISRDMRGGHESVAITIEALDSSLVFGQLLYAAPASVKYDDTLLPFLALMRNELHANSHKGDREGWLRMTLENALDEIRHHCDKLIVPVMNQDTEVIREHAADVANCAMMLADIAGVLSRE